MSVSNLVFLILLPLMCDSAIIVTGARGRIGSKLAMELKRQGFTTLLETGRYDNDLRQPNSLSRYKNVQFCFFLAHDDREGDFALRSNMQMYQNSFHALWAKEIPFLFASSHLAADPASPVGQIKASGEKLATQFGGKITRFWDVITDQGASGVLNDAVRACVYPKHSKRSLHLQAARYAHVNELVIELIQLMKKFYSLPNIVDVTSREIPGEEFARVALETLPCHNSNFGYLGRLSTSHSNPANFWEVPFDIVKYIQAVAKVHMARQESWRARNVYLSVITTMRNDNYNGIRGRYFSFLNQMFNVVSDSDLDYELIVVQYNPSNQSLPITQQYPFTHYSSNLRVRVITVPGAYHLHSKRGKLWEFVGKNVGAKRAKGLYLLFTNVDNLFPRSIFMWIAKGSLDKKKVYQASMFRKFVSPSGHVHEAQKFCEQVASGYHFCQKNGNCAGDQLLGRGLGYRTTAVGDFSIFNRETFLHSGGYLEIPQNLNVEMGHLRYVTAKLGLRRVFLDDCICHQDHSRVGRPRAPLGSIQIASRHPGDLKFGLEGINLPEATVDSVYDYGFNGEDHYGLYHHHHYFHEYQPVFLKLESSYLIDFLGIRTAYTLECPSASFRCHRHHELHDVLDYNLFGIPLMGDFPYMDQDYFEWVALLHAVRPFRSSFRQNFSMVEFCSGFSEWSLRAIAAIEQGDFKGGALASIIASSDAALKNTHRLLLDNHFHTKILSPSQLFARQNSEVVLTYDPPETPCLQKVLALRSGSVLSIAHIHDEFTEVCLARIALEEALNSLCAVFIHTHHLWTHALLLEKLLSIGWTVELNIPMDMGTFKSPSLGFIEVKRGILWLSRKNNPCQGL